MAKPPAPLPIIEPEAVGFCSQRLKRVDDYITSAIAQNEVPNAAILVARSGKIVYQTLVGQRDIEAGEPLQPDTIYRIASMSKPITAVAAMMLLEEGKVQLEDPIAKFIPEFADPQVFSDGDKTIPANCEITIRHLFTHTSGIGYAFLNDRLGALMEKAGLKESPIKLTTGEYIRKLAQLPLVNHPGEAWLYGYSLDVLGHLIEVLSGLTFDDFLQKRLFAPLSMHDTGFFVPEDKRNRLATLYAKEDDHWVHSTESSGHLTSHTCCERQSCHFGGADLVSTLNDYTRFAQMLLNGGQLDGVRLLGRKTVGRMATNSIGDIEMSMLFPIPFAIALHGDTMGLGMGIRQDRGRFGGLESVGSFGWGGGFNTVFWVDPAEELIGVVMSQCTMNMAFLQALRTLTYQALVD